MRLREKLRVKLTSQATNNVKGGATNQGRKQKWELVKWAR